MKIYFFTGYFFLLCFVFYWTSHFLKHFSPDSDIDQFFQGSIKHISCLEWVYFMAERRPESWFEAVYILKLRPVPGLVLLLWKFSTLRAAQSRDLTVCGLCCNHACCCCTCNRRKRGRQHGDLCVHVWFGLVEAAYVTLRADLHPPARRSLTAGRASHTISFLWKVFTSSSLNTEIKLSEHFS